MPVESGTYIDDLNTANPVGATDGVAEGDNHLRLIKSILKNTFPNATRAFRFEDVPATKTSNYSVVTTDDRKLIPVNASGASRTITLPAAATAGAGFTVSVAKTDSSSNAVVIDGNGSELINGLTTISLLAHNEMVKLWCDGTRWLAMMTSATFGITDAGGYFTGDNVEDVLQEIGANKANKVYEQAIYIHPGQMNEPSTGGASPGVYTSSGGVKIPSFAFADGVIQNVDMFFLSPAGADDTVQPTFKLWWAHETATAFDVVWQGYDQEIVSGTTDFDTLSAAHNVDVDSGGAVDRAYETTERGFTTGAMSPGQLCHFRVRRTGNSGADTLDATAHLLGVEIRFTRTTNDDG